MPKYTEKQQAARRDMAQAKRVMRDAEMYQKPKKLGSHVAEVTEIGPASWNISAWSNHPSYSPPQEHILNTVLDIVSTESGGSLKCEVLSSTDIVVTASCDYDLHH